MGNEITVKVEKTIWDDAIWCRLELTHELRRVRSQIVLFNKDATRGIVKCGVSYLSIIEHFGPTYLFARIGSYRCIIGREYVIGESLNHKY
jgi:hypothetical protein